MSKDRKTQRDLMCSRPQKFDKEQFINDVCNDKYILIIGGEVVLDGYSTAKKELGDITEPLLAKALNLIAGDESRFMTTPFDDITETPYNVINKGPSSISRFIVSQ